MDNAHSRFVTISYNEQNKSKMSHVQNLPYHIVYVVFTNTFSRHVDYVEKVRRPCNKLRQYWFPEGPSWRVWLLYTKNARNMVLPREKEAKLVPTKKNYRNFHTIS